MWVCFLLKSEGPTRCHVPTVWIDMAQYLYYIECYRFCKLATDRRALLTGLFLTPQKEKLPAHRSFWVPRNWQPFYVDATNANDQFCWSYAYPSIPTVLVCRILQVRWFLVLPKNTWWLYVAMLPFLVCDSCCWEDSAPSPGQDLRQSDLHPWQPGVQG
jgi:hypothetical protein